jgi:hypothetical protein
MTILSTEIVLLGVVVMPNICNAGMSEIDLNHVLLPKQQ